MVDSKIKKIRPVSEDKSSFCDLVDPTRRTGKAANLKDEEIDRDLYDSRAKTSGFGTLRPVEWLVAIERFYENVDDLSSEWFYVKNQDKITECQLYYYIHNVKWVVFHVYLNTGVILAKGLLHSAWAEFEFNKILNLVNNASSDVGPSADFMNSLQKLQEGRVSTKRNNIQGNVSSSGGGSQVDDSIQFQPSTEQQASNESANHMSEFDTLWKENNEIKTALKTVEDNLLIVNQALEKIDQTLKDKDITLENIVKNFELKLDSRLSIELDIIKQDVDNEIKKVNNRINDKFNNLKKSTDEKILEIQQRHDESLKKECEHLHKIYEQRVQEQINVFKNQWIKDKDEFLKFVDDERIVVNTEKVELPERSEVHFDTEVESASGSVTASESCDAEIIVMMDSNRRFLDPNLLTPNENMKVKIFPCHNFKQSLNILENVSFTKVKVIILHFGVNDIEYQSSEQFCLNLKHLINRLRVQFKDTKILVSEVTPRMDELNIKVSECNAHLKSLFRSDTNVYIIYHSFLDNRDYFYDSKHIKREFVNRLASNLKKALRRALGIFNPRHNKNNQNRSWFNNDKSYSPRMSLFDMTSRRDMLRNSPRQQKDPVSSAQNTFNQAQHRFVEQVDTNHGEILRDQTIHMADLKKILSDTLGKLTQFGL